MSYTLIWMRPAIGGLVRLRSADPLIAKTAKVAILALAEDPFPDDSRAFGTGGQRRLRVDTLRVLYEVDDDLAAITILSVGRSKA